MTTLELTSLSNDIASLRSDVKNLAKLVRKVRNHQEDPTGEKAKARTKNNGFNRQMEVSDKLKAFLELAEGETVSRSDVTRRVNKYIKEKELKHPDNGRVIVLDDGLSKLLAPPDGEQVTFLNMQKYISPHYIKPADEVTDSSTEAAEALVTLNVPEAAPSPTSPPAAEKKKAPKRPTVRKQKA